MERRQNNRFMERRQNNRCPICEQPLREGSCSNCGYPYITENFQNKIPSRIESSIERLGNAIKFQGIVRNLEWKEKNYGVRSSGSSRSYSSWIGGTSEIRIDRYDRYEILTFRIEQVDSNGNISYVPVYLKAREIEGVLSDGDEVEVTGRMDKTKTVVPSSIRVVNTDGYIKITHKNEVDGPLEHLEIESSSGCLSIFIIVIPIPFLLAVFLT